MLLLPRFSLILCRFSSSRLANCYLRLYGVQCMCPSVAVFYSNRSLCFKRRRMWSEALRDAVTALELDPQLYKAHMLRGEAKCNLGDWDSGIPSLKRAIEVQSERRRVSLAAFSMFTQPWDRLQSGRARRNALLTASKLSWKSTCALDSGYRCANTGVTPSLIFATTCRCLKERFECEAVQDEMKDNDMLQFLQVCAVVVVATPSRWLM